MPLARRFTLPANVPQWVTLISGILLGCVLTSTFTFHLRWCTDKVSLSDVSLDRQTVSIIKVNEHIRTHRKGVAVDGGRERGVDGLDSEWEEDCVCGDELKKLKTVNELPTNELEKYSRTGLDPTYKASSLVTKPSIATFSPKWDTGSSGNKSGNYSVFVHPPPEEQEEGREQLLSEEFLLRRSFIVAVNVPDNGLKWASEIFDTWGQDVPQILFFISETCNLTEPESIGLPLVKLSVADGLYDSAVQKSFSIIQYLHKNYQDAFHWFVLVGTQTFVWARRMGDVLQRFDSSAKVYLGWAAKGRPEDAEFLQLLPNENYCLGAPGVVFSSAALRALGQELPFCVKSLMRHNEEEDNLWTNWDVEIGRCVYRRVGIQCSQSAEAKAYFYQDFSPKASISKQALAHPPFNHLLTYFPITSLSGHARLHFNYKKKEYHNSLESTRYLQQQVNSLCSELEEEEQQGRCSVYICPCQETAESETCASKCPAANTVTTLSKSYAPTSKFDIPSWQYFDSFAVFNDETTIPGHWLNLRKDLKKELQTVMNRVLQEARAQTGHRLLRFRKILNGYVRHNPSRGMEYIIDAEYSEGRNILKTRTSLVRPLAKNYITLQDNDDKITQVNFIVPISNVNKRFQEFMTMYEGCCLKQDTALHLVLVVYGENDIAFVKDVIQPFLAKYKKAKITVVEGSGVFSRGRALHLGMSSLSPEELAFHCDVDMTILTPFLQRCRKNTIRGKRVYYPEFFKLYNLDYVYYKRPQPKKIPLKRQHGHWASYSFGMLCIYKSDYDEVGGMDTNIIGWGEEDVKFYEMVLKKKYLEVFRVPDPGLTHRWHEKHCSDDLSEEQKSHCFSSRGENLADRIQLANFIYDNNYQLKYPSVPDQPQDQHQDPTVNVSSLASSSHKT